MTSPVELQSVRPGIVIGDEWAPILTGTINVGDGPDTIITLTATPTPSVTAEVRARSRGIVSNSATHVYTVGTTKRIGPFTVDDTNGDIIAVEARRTTGTGGLVIIDAAALQGNFTDQPGDGGAQTQTGITAQPTNKSTTPGVSATFAVSAVGTNLTFQWEEWDGGTWSNVGASAPSYTVSNPTTGMDGYQYRVTVSGDLNPPGGPVTSNTVTLTVGTSSAVITSEPADRSVVEGNSATFTVYGLNIDGYTLYRRTTGTGNGTAIESVASGYGSGSVSYTHTNAVVGDDGTEYRWGLFGTDDVEIFSRWAMLNVSTASTGAILATDSEVG